MLLALDTSGAMVTAAVHSGGAAAGVAGAGVLAERSVEQAGQHAERLAPLIAEVLAVADAVIEEVEAIAVGIGPGPFTGLRVGLVTARVLGLARQVPVYGVCSLDALAQQVIDAGLAPQDAGEPDDGESDDRESDDAQFLVATDARRREVYWASYRDLDGHPERIGEPAVSVPAEVPVRGRPVFGRGALLYPEHLGP
ncbi:MAG: tRNA (adenosine(37)-N6)-threonylcarbamoyltransferase complex dimerization subunit type 1 TsaB, partial [Kineosporiaceae bacterium]